MYKLQSQVGWGITLQLCPNNLNDRTIAADLRTGGRTQSQKACDGKKIFPRNLVHTGPQGLFTVNL